MGAVHAESWDDGDAGDSFWNTGDNWNPNGVPAAGEDADFDDNDSNTDCTLQAAGTCRDLDHVNGYTATVNINSTLSVTRDLLWNGNSAGTLAVGAAGTINVARNATLTANPILANSGTIAFTGGTAANWTSPAGNPTWGNVTISKTAATVTLLTDVTVANLVISSGTLDLNGFTLTVTGTVAVNAGTLSVGTGTLDAGGLITVGDGAGLASTADLTVGATGAVNAGGGLTVDFTNDGDYTPSTSTLTFDGAGAWSGGGDDFGTVVVTAAVTGGNASMTTLTITGGSLTPGAGNNLDVNGLVSGSGTLAMTGAVNLNTAGGLTVTTYTQGTGTLTFDGAGTWASAGPFTTTAVEIASGGGTVAVTGDKSVASLTMTSGTLNAAGDTIAVSGVTAFDGGIVGVGSSTVLDLNGNVTSSGGTINQSAGQVNFGGLNVNLSSTAFNGTLTGVVNFDRGANTTTLTPGPSVDFFSVVVGLGSTVAVSGANPLDVDGTLTVTGTLNLTGDTATVAGNFGGTGTLLLNTGSLSLAGGLANFGGLGTFTATTGTVTLTGNGQTLTPNATAFFNLTVNQSAAAGDVLVSTNPLGVTGALLITQGELQAQTALSVTGTATVNDTLSSTTNSLTHTFLSGLSVGSGANASFQPTTLSMTVIFGDASTSTITGTLTVAGNQGLADYVTLRSQTATGWSITPTGTVSVTRARVQNSTASANINGSISFNDGGNTNWTFLAKTTRWTSGVAGFWSVDTNWSEFAPVDGDTVEFTGIGGQTGNSTVNVAGLDLDSINMAASGAYPGNLTISTALHTTNAVGGTTTLAGGTIAVNAGLTIDGIMVQGSGALNVAAGVTLQVGGAATSGGTLSIPATAVGDFNGNLTLNGTSKALNGTVDVEGNLTGTASNVTGAGAITVAGGTVDMDGMTVAFSGGTFTLDGAGQALTVDSAVSFSTLIVAGSSTMGLTVSSGELEVATLLTVTGQLTLDSEATDVNGSVGVTGTLIGGGGDIRSAGNVSFAGATAFTPTGSVLVFDGAGAQNLNQGGLQVADVTVSKAAGTLSWTGPTNLSGNLTVTNGNVTLPNAANNIDGDLDLSNAGADTLTLSGNTLTIGDDVDLSGAGGFVLGGTTLTFDGTAIATLNTGGITLGVVNASKSGGGTLTLSASSTFSGVVTVTGNTLQTVADNLTHTFQAGVVVQTGATFSAANTAGPTNLVFFEGTTLNVQAGGTFSVAGSAGNQIVLRDQTAGGATWALTRSGTVTVDLADVADSVASAPVVATNSIDSLNNTNWSFPGGITTWVGGISSDWSLNANWTAGSPAANDIVQFSGSVACNMNEAAPETVISMDMTGYTGTLTLQNTLTVTGDATFVGTTNLTTFTLNVGGNYAQASGALNTGTGSLLVTGTSDVSGTLNVNGGVATLGGNVLPASSGTIQGSGTLNLNGAAVDVSSCAVSFTGSTNFGAAAPATLTLANDNDAFSGPVVVGGAGLTLAGTGDVTLGGTLAVNQSLDTGGRTATVGGLTTIAAARTLTVSGGTVTLTGGVAGTGSISQSGGNVDIPSAVVNLDGLASYAGAAGGGLRLTGAVPQDLQLDGAVALNDLRVGSSGGTVTVSGAAGLNLAGDLQVSANLTLSATGASVVGGTVTIDGGDTLNTNTQNFSVTGTTTVSGSLTTGAGTIDLNGNLTGGGTFTAGAGTVQLGGASVDLNGLAYTQAVGTTTLDRATAQVFQVNPADGFQNLTVGSGGGAVTFSNSTGLTVANTLTVNAPLTLSFSAAGSLSAGGLLLNTAAAGNVFNVNGENVTVSGNTNLAQGTLSVNAGTTDLQGGVLTLAANATVNQTNGTLRLRATLLPLGTLAAFNATGGTTVLQAAVAQTLTVGANVDFSNLTVGAAGASLAGGLLDVAGNLTLTGNLVTGANSVDVEGNLTGAAALNATNAPLVEVDNAFTPTAFTAGTLLRFTGTGSWGAAGGANMGAVEVTGGTRTLAAGIPATGLTVSDGATVALATFTLTVSGDVTVGGGASGALGNGALTLGGTLIWNAGSAATANLALSFTGAGAVGFTTQAGLTFQSVTVNKPGGTVTVTNTLVAGTGGITLTAGSLALGGSLTSSGSLDFSGGAFSMGAPASVMTLSPAGTITVDMGAGNLVTGNLSVTSGTAQFVNNPLLVGNAAGVRASTTVALGATLDVNVSTTLSGATTINGTLDASQTGIDVLFGDGQTTIWGPAPARIRVVSAQVDFAGTNSGSWNLTYQGATLEFTPSLPAPGGLTLANSTVVTGTPDGQNVVTDFGGNTLGGAIGWLNLFSPDAVWNGSSDTSWANPLNWTPNTVPLPGSRVIFNAAVPRSPQLNSPTSVGAIDVTAGFNSAGGAIVLGQDMTASGDISLAVNANGAVLDLGGNVLAVAGSGNTLAIPVNNGTLRFQGGAQTLATPSASLTLGAALVVGNGGATSLDFQTSGTVLIAPSVTVADAATLNLGGVGTSTLDSNGAFDVLGTLTVAASNTIRVAGNMNWATADGITISGSAVLRVDGAGAQALQLPAAAAVSNLTLAKTPGTTLTTSGGTITFSQNYLQTTGNLTLGNATFDVDGTFTLSAGTFTAGATAVNVEGAWDSSLGVFAGGTSTVTLDGGGAQAFTFSANTTPFNLTVANGGTTTLTGVPAAATLNLGGTLAVTGGTLQLGTGGMSVVGALSFAGGATLNQAAANASFAVQGDVNFTNGNLAPGATAPFGLSGAAQSLTPAGEAFANVVFGGTGTKTLVGGELVSNAQVTLGAGVTLDIDGNDLRLTSSSAQSTLLLGTGAFADTAGTGAVVFNTSGTPAQYLVGGFTFPALTINPAGGVTVFSNPVALQVTRTFALQAGTFTNNAAVVVGGATQIATTFTLAAQLTSNTITGGGNLVVTGQSVVLTGTANPLSVTTVTGLNTGAPLSTVTYQNGGGIRTGATYGNLVIGAGIGTPQVGNDITISGNLTFTASSSNLAATTNLFFVDAGSVFDLGIANPLGGLAINQLNVNLSASTLTLELQGTAGIARLMQDLQVTQGEVLVRTDWAIGQGTVGAGTGTAQLTLREGGVSLTLGGAGTNTLVVNDTLAIGDGAALGLGFFFNNAGGAATISVGASGTLSFSGTTTSPLTVASSPDDSIAQINAVAGATVSAANVSVQDNDASGVVNGPIVASGISIDLGNTTNWEFAEGGSLRIAAAAIQGDGSGSVTSVRVVYSQPINSASVGSVHERYELRLTDGAGNTLLTRSGVATNIVTSARSDVLEIVLGAPIPQTDLTNLEFVYTPPASGFLTSQTGIPAANAETATPGGTTPLLDAAAPVITGFFFRDDDGNGGAEALVINSTEPLGSTSGKGISLSAFGPSTNTTDMAGATQLYLQVAGQALTAINLAPIVQLPTGDLIAERITQAVQQQSTLIADPLLKPALLNFTCVYDGDEDRYVLTSGVPLAFAAGAYSLDWARSTVVVLAGANDAAPFLRLGTANGGVEFSGFGDAQVGLSVSAQIPNPAALVFAANTAARYQFNSEDFRSYTIPPGVSTLTSLADELQTQFRATTNEAYSPPSQVSYTQAVAVADTVRNRLIVIPGGQGAGVRAVAASEPGGADGFASVALVGSDNFGIGAVETTGTDNSMFPIGDLNVVGIDGSNMLLGSPAPLVVGNTITYLLSNLPGAGTTPSFRLADNRDGGFIRDQATVPNLYTGSLTNLLGTSNAALIGDADGDLTLVLNPGGVTVDASPSVPFFGVAGETVTYSWDYRSGPGPISISGASIAAPSSAVATTAALGFSATTSTPTGTFYEFLLTITVLDGAGNPVVSAQTDANGQQQVVIRVTISSLVPVALAGPDQAVQLQAMLDGSASFDPNGGTLTFQWQAATSAGSALPSTVFDDPTSATPTFTPNLTDTFVVTLGVTKASDTSQISSDTVSITVFDPSNLPPTADAGESQTGRVNAAVILDGGNSVDPRGGTLTYEWTLGSAPSLATLNDPASETPTFTPSVPGTYQWNLVVRAPNGSSDSDSVQVIVQDDLSAQPRLAPGAEPRALGVNYGVFPVNTPNGTSSAIAIYPGGVEVTTTLVDLTGETLTNPGNFELEGLQAIRVVTNQTLFGLFYVLPPAGGPAPLALRFPDGQQDPVLLYGEVGQPFVLDGSASQDDGVITTFNWTQESGPFAFQSQTGSFVSVLPATAGTYTFTLVVTDNISQSSLPRTLSVPVVPAGNLNLGPPLAVIAPGGGASVAPAATAGGRVLPAATVAQATVGQQLTLNAAGSLSNSGGTLSFSWRQLKGPVVVAGGTTQQTLSVVPTSPGAYLFEVTATDASGVQQSERVWITVTTAGNTAPVARIASVPAQTIPSTGVLELVLNGQGSSGTSGLTYRWSQTRGSPVFIDATSGSAAITQVRQPGIYTFELRVDDGQVRSAPAEVTVFVEANQDLALASGATTSSSSGGCSVSPADAGWGWAFALLLFGVPIVRRRSEVTPCA